MHSLTRGRRPIAWPQIKIACSDVNAAESNGVKDQFAVASLSSHGHDACKTRQISGIVGGNRRRDEQNDFFIPCAAPPADSRTSVESLWCDGCVEQSFADGGGVRAEKAAGDWSQEVGRGAFCGR